MYINYSFLVKTDVEWTMKLAENFLKTLMDVTHSNDIEELKDAFIIDPVWVEVEKKMCIRKSRLKYFWYFQLHMQLFSPFDLSLNLIKIKLIE